VFRRIGHVQAKQGKLMESYHYAWLSEHPERTEGWLQDRLKDGFAIHHMDGNHSNDEPRNLVLIESGDHMMIHNGVKRMPWKPNIARHRPKESAEEKLVKKMAKLEVMRMKVQAHDWGVKCKSEGARVLELSASSPYGRNWNEQVDSFVSA
jgi:hypothetical protein